MFDQNEKKVQYLQLILNFKNNNNKFECFGKA